MLHDTVPFAMEIGRELYKQLSPEDQEEVVKARAEGRRFTAVTNGSGGWCLRDHLNFTSLPYRETPIPEMPHYREGAEKLANCLNAELASRAGRGQHSELPEDIHRSLGEEPDIRDLFYSYLAFGDFREVTGENLPAGRQRRLY